MSTRFVLVHGAWHRGSCWAPLTAELRARGHAVVAPDMPSDESGRGARDYADAVLTAVEGAGPEPLVLVAHSLGGLSVPLAAERLGPDRVAAIVLVAAMSAVPGTSFIGRMSEESLMVPGYDQGVRRGERGSTYWPPDAVADGLYRGVAEEIDTELGDGGEAVVAAADLRPQTWTIGKEVTPLSAWPAVRTVSVVCAGDRVADPDACRRAAAAVGADVVELDGGHFPMLTRPAELAEILVDVAGPPRIDPTR